MVTNIADHRRLLLVPDQVDPVAFAVQDVRRAVADFVMAAHDAQSLDELLDLRKIISDLTVELMAAESVALDRMQRVQEQRKD